MATSATVIIALRFATGVVFASDSQTSDPAHNVRWQTTKAQQVGQHPLVVAFSGNTGISGRARESIRILNFRASTFQKRERVRKMIESALKQHYDWIAERMKLGTAFDQVIGSPRMIALAACFAEGNPQIIEFGQDGDSDFFECFHAVGSGAATAQAVWRTLGKRRLSVLPEERALHVVLRIMRIAVDVDMVGISEPFTVFVIDETGVREVAPVEMDALLQQVEEWEEEQVLHLLEQPRAE